MGKIKKKGKYMNKRKKLPFTWDLEFRKWFKKQLNKYKQNKI